MAVKGSSFRQTMCCVWATALGLAKVDKKIVVEYAGIVLCVTVCRLLVKWARKERHVQYEGALVFMRSIYAYQFYIVCNALFRTRTHVLCC